MRFIKSKSKNNQRQTSGDPMGVADATKPEENEPIYYFGYGALVNPISRQRRGVSTEEAQVALLPNYRLTFSFGGAATIVPKTGFEVYGIVMKCSSLKDWNLLKDFDAGYDCVEVDVFPLKQNCTIQEGEGFAPIQEQSMRARVFVMPQDKMDKANTNNLPQERYLKVIASGMRAYGVDQDYINDEILGVEFIPSRSPDNYFQCPLANPDQPPPSLSLSSWNKECQKRLNQANKKNVCLILFRLGEHAIQIQNATLENPLCVWLKDRMVGPQDSTWVLIQTLFDPDLPVIASPEEVTPLHSAWAENELMDKFQQAGIEATTIYHVRLPHQDSTLPAKVKPRLGKRIQSGLRRSFGSFRSISTEQTNMSNNSQDVSNSTTSSQ